MPTHAFAQWRTGWPGQAWSAYSGTPATERAAGAASSPISAFRPRRGRATLSFGSPSYIAIANRKVVARLANRAAVQPGTALARVKRRTSDRQHAVKSAAHNPADASAGTANEFPLRLLSIGRTANSCGLASEPRAPRSRLARPRKLRDQAHVRRGFAESCPTCAAAMSHSPLESNLRRERPMYLVEYGARFVAAPRGGQRLDQPERAMTKANF